MLDMAGMAAGIADNALHGAHSTGQFGADNLNTVATVNTADIANTADTEHPSIGCRGHRPVPEGRGCLREANSKV